MLFNEVMKELEAMGSEQTVKIYKNHGADIPLFGVSIANIKKLAKKYKKNNHTLGVQLLNSGNVDAIYLSQYIVDPNLLTIIDLEKIMDSTEYYMLLDNVVANLAARNKEIAFECLYKWIESENKRYRQVAYGIYSLILSSYNDELIDKNHVVKTVEYIRKNIHEEENRVRYNMNNFLIVAGTNYGDLTNKYKDYAKEIGKVEVYMGKTSCKVPDAYSYIEKIEKMGNIGKKRKI